MGRRKTVCSRGSIHVVMARMQPPSVVLTRPSPCFAHTEHSKSQETIPRRCVFLWLIVAALRPFCKSEAHLRLTYHTAVAALYPTALLLSPHPGESCYKMDLSRVTPLTLDRLSQGASPATRNRRHSRGPKSKFRVFCANFSEFQDPANHVQQ